MINSKKKGFTIVELVIVVAVIAILAAVLIPTFSNLVKKANESADIQAVRNMNVYLAQAEATDGINSILDVYEIFDESDYVVENYQPLYKGRYFFYDKQRNQILYVDEGDQVLFPNDIKGQDGHDWFSLSTEIALKEPSNVADNESKITYTISTAEQYAWVVKQLNKGFSKDVEIIIDANLDFRGANVTISEVDLGKKLTINGNNKTIKNITSNVPMSVSNENSNNSYNEYNVAGLIANALGSVSIFNLTLENVNVKQINAGNAAILIGSTSTGNVSTTEKTISISNVTIKNSAVIGNRNTGSLIGAWQQTSGKTSYTASEVKLINVDVKTVVGYSGLVYGYVHNNAKAIVNAKLEESNIKMENCSFGVYKCELNTGKCLGCSENCDNDGSDGSIHGYSYTLEGQIECRKGKGTQFNTNYLYYGYVAK